MPTISARTVGLHYGKHHKGYYDKLNVLVQGKPYADMTLAEVVVAARKANDADVFNNAAQAWNHNLYWESFKGGPAAPKGAFAQQVEKDFQSLVGLSASWWSRATMVFRHRLGLARARWRQARHHRHEGRHQPAARRQDGAARHRRVGARLLSRL